MKKKMLLTLSLLVFALLVFAACAAPESKNQEIIDAYKKAGYSLNPTGTEAAKTAFEKLGEEYKVDYLAKDLGTASAKMFILFKCKTEKESKDVENTYKDIYTVKRSGVDVIIFFAGLDATPWDSVFAA